MKEARRTTRFKKSFRLLTKRNIIFRRTTKRIHKTNNRQMTQLDYDLENYLNELDKEFECYECGTSISKEGYCSRECYKAGQE